MDGSAARPGEVAPRDGTTKTRNPFVPKATRPDITVKSPSSEPGTSARVFSMRPFEVGKEITAERANRRALYLWTRHLNIGDLLRRRLASGELTEGARDDFVRALAPHGDPDWVRRFVRMHLKGYNRAKLDRIMVEALAAPIPTAAELGRILRLTPEEREACRVTTIHAVSPPKGRRAK